MSLTDYLIDQRAVEANARQIQQDALRLAQNYAGDDLMFAIQYLANQVAARDLIIEDIKQHHEGTAHAA